jgi:hypothetical protein
MQSFYDDDGKRLGGIDEAVIRRCPFRLLRFEHYRSDGICRCDDPTHSEMIKWRFKWEHGRWRSDGYTGRLSFDWPYDGQRRRPPEADWIEKVGWSSGS